jgi:predicted nicotinamide N-methyase
MVPSVPEVKLWTATDATALWQVTQAWLDERGVEPPYWAFPWAGGQALARWVLDHPGAVRGRSIVDFACGSGLVAVAASMAGARVEAVDVDPVAVRATQMNADLNDVAFGATCEDIVGRPLVGVDALLAGDVFFDAGMARRFDPWLRALVRSGVEVLVGDPGRAYVPPDYVTVATYDVSVPVELEGTSSKRTSVLRPPS